MNARSKAVFYSPAASTVIMPARESRDDSPVCYCKARDGIIFYYRSPSISHSWYGLHHDATRQQLETKELFYCLALDSAFYSKKECNRLYKGLISAGLMTDFLIYIKDYIATYPEYYPGCERRT